MSSTPELSQAAQQAFRDEWMDFISTHNNPNRKSYVGSFAEPNPSLLKMAYEKFLRAAEFLNPHTVVIPLTELSRDETNAILLYLDKTGVHSSIDWAQPQNIPQLVIREGNNLKHQTNPVETIRQQQTKLKEISPDVSVDIPLDIDLGAQDESAAKPEKLYIPPFNILPTTKGFYILIEHMHYEDVNHLSKALKSKGIPFTEKDSDSHGLVYSVDYVSNKLEELGSLIRESRSQENLDRAPENARIYRPSKGCPAINLLDDNGQPCIPIEGLMYQQVTALEERLKQSGIPFSRVEKSSFGFVFAIPETHSEKAEALSRLLRREHNERKEASKSAEAAPQQHPTNKEPV